MTACLTSAEQEERHHNEAHHQGELALVLGYRRRIGHQRQTKGERGQRGDSALPRSV